MRICLLAHSNSPWTPDYASYLRDSGHEVHVVSFHPKQLQGVHNHYVGITAADGRLPKWVYPLRVPRMWRLLRQIQPDVVLATYVQSNGLVGALTKCSALVVSSRGSDHRWGLPLPLARKLTSWIGGRAELLHASSPQLKESLAACGIPPDKITVIPLGTDPEEFIPRRGLRPEGPPRIVCTRKHYPLYDNETIIRALARLWNDGFAFECQFAGTGPTVRNAEDLSRRLGLSDSVTFLGEVTRAEVALLLRWADIYVSAAISDGAPSSLFEAMSTGLFPVVSDVRANQDWLEHRGTGFLCEIGNERAYAEGIRFVWEERDLVARAGRTNRRVVSERCNRPAHLLTLEQLLAKAVRLYSGAGD